MPLTLVLGPANSAKAGEVLGAYADAAHQGALLVVPTAADADYYTRELAGDGAILGAVLTFSGLAGEVARRAGYSGRRCSALQRQRVLRRTVERAGLIAIRESASAPGFAVAAGALIAELERSMVSPQRFTQALTAWAAVDSRREPFARDLGALYRAYLVELERIGRVDAELYAWRALDALRADPRRWGTTPVFLYGFDDLGPLERDAVETLSRVAGVAVTVSLSYEPGQVAFAARAQAVEALRPLAERVLELPALDDHYADGSRAALHHLERSLFEPAAARVDPGGAVRLLEAGGERAEAELIAAEVLELLRGGVRGDQIVVVNRSLGRAGPLLRSVFSGYGIAVAMARRLMLRDVPLGRGLLALCRSAWAVDAGAEDLLEYLRTPGVVERAERADRLGAERADRPGAERADRLGAERADRLEAELRRAGERTLAAARERLGFELGEIDALACAGDPGAELARQARRLFAAPHRERAPSLDTDQELDARVLATVLRAVGELQELDERLSGAELLELLSELEVPASLPARPGAVLIAEPLEIRARRFRAVFVSGLQEGAFPLPAAPEPFLSDERRRELALASGLALGLGEDSLARERYLFYACVSRATDQVVVSYSSSDEEGNLELRSPFLADLEELFVEGWSDRRRRRLLGDVVWDPSAAPTERELARALADTRAPSSGAPQAPPRVLSETARAQVRHTEIVSAGALESYADCPVKWLVERELSPARFEPEPDPVARGGYMHAVLEELIRRLEGPVTPASLPEARAILAELLTDLPVQVAAGRPEPVREAARASIRADLNRYLEHEAAAGAGWQPEGLELRFGFAGEEGSLPAVQLEDGVRVRGVIDRVDVDPTGSGRAIVRDYKSGSARPEQAVSHWRDDRQLQVALYMVAVRQLLGLDPVAGFYQPLGGGDLRPRGVYLQDAHVGTRLFPFDAREAPELEELLEDAGARAVELAARLRAGDLAPCPQTCSRDGCLYPGICRSQ